MVIQVNRAPVLTLWAALVAERLGFDEDEALTIGQTVAGLNRPSGCDSCRIRTRIT
ncbi:MAG: hypothetical protein WCK73_15380 [Deltaproteobacteria bacterium]